MLTMRRDALIRNKARELGANGYILKTIGGEKMLNAFEQCLLDDNFFFDAFAIVSALRIFPAFLIFAVMVGKPLLIKNYTWLP
jgi:DNA-binding NarL/FixJ family response regulator